MALLDAQAAVSSGFRLLLSLATVASGADRLGTIDLPLRCASGGVFGFSAVLTYWLRWLQAPIDWGQSIYHCDAQAAAS